MKRGRLSRPPGAQAFECSVEIDNACFCSDLKKTPKGFITPGRIPRLAVPIHSNLLRKDGFWDSHSTTATTSSNDHTAVQPNRNPIQRASQDLFGIHRDLQSNEVLRNEAPKPGIGWFHWEKRPERLG